MTLCEIYPSGCGRRDLGRSTSVTRLLVASNDNVRGLVQVGAKALVDKRDFWQAESEDPDFSSLSAVPFGYIEAGAKDIGLPGTVATAFFTFFVVGKNPVTGLLDFLASQVVQSYHLSFLTHHWVGY